MQKLICALLVVLCSQISFAQKKFEKEERIERDDIPKLALKFVEELKLKSKIKWFKETGLSTTTFEAKTRSKGKKYSIEFNNSGNLEDVEISISKKEIKKDVLNKIESDLKKKLEKFKIQKIQLQYSGSKEAVQSKILKNEHNKDLIINYEIIVSAKVNKKFQKFEYLFSDLGAYIQYKTIVLINTDNLEY